MLFYASILSQMPMLRRIFRCIGPNQKNQPHLDLYLVRRYTICHFPIGVLYLCICQNQKNQPNLVLYLSQPWQMHVQGSNLLFNHPICHYLSAMDKKAQNAAHYRIMDSLELTIDTCLQWRVILTLRPPSVTLSSEPGMKWKLACKFVNTCHITILVYTLPSWSALADRYRTNVTTLTVKKNRAWCIIKYIDWHSTWMVNVFYFPRSFIPRRDLVTGHLFTLQHVMDLDISSVYSMAMELPFTNSVLYFMELM